MTLNNIHFISNLTALDARLPELEWKISNLSLPFLHSSLPPGLFQQKIESPSCYVAEIRHNIHLLVEQRNSRAGFFLARRILQQINSLVILSSKQPERKPTDKAFTLSKVSTRQQWLQTVIKDRDQLEKQKSAIQNTLHHMLEKNTNQEAILNLKKDLGAIEQRLTLAEEAYALSSS